MSVVDDMLKDASLASRLAQLGFQPEDADEFRNGLESLDGADLQTIGRDLAALRAHIGRIGQRQNPVPGPVIEHVVGVDFPLLVALVAVSSEVGEELMRRGLSEELTRRTLSDLGQQVSVHRRVHGCFGFSDRDWVPANYSGSLLWLGRLQYSLENVPELGWVLGCHIPETGALTPELVDESLDMAARIATRVFREFPIQGVTCTSWLLDSGVLAGLPPESNLARFGSRFERFGEPRPDRRDALYFGFHRETRNGEEVDLSGLPRDTSLQRAVVAQLEAGATRVESGWMPLPGA